MDFATLISESDTWVIFSLTALSPSTNKIHLLEQQIYWRGKNISTKNTHFLWMNFTGVVRWVITDVLSEVLAGAVGTSGQVDEILTLTVNIQIDL